MLTQKKNSKSKTDNTTRRIKSEDTGERRKIKKVLQQDKQYRGNWKFQNNKKTFYQQLGRDCTKGLPTTK